MTIALMLFGLALGPRSSLAAGKPNAAAPVDTLMDKALHLQEALHGLRDWAKQVGRKKAFKLLASSGSVRELYGLFETKLQGREIAWVIARKDVNLNLSSEVHFIEHNGSRSAGLKNLETSVRCYVEDAIAERARAAAPGTMVLCIGKIVDIEFFQNFISLGIKARKVAIGQEGIESWAGAQAKLAKRDAHSDKDAH